jgi:hypothetical protein
MHQFKNHFLLAAIGGLVFFASCKKESTPSSTVEPDEPLSRDNILSFSNHLPPMQEQCLRNEWLK